MTTRALRLALHDLRLQYRYGIYVAYAFVVVFYVSALVAGRQWLPGWVPAAIIFSDPAAVGFFFLGALMMLERTEGVRAALAVSPAGPSDYLGGKIITLTGLSLVATAILAVVIGDVAEAPLLLVAVGLTSVQYLAIGVPIALRFRTVNAYLVGAAGWLTPLIAPGFLAVLDPLPAWLLVIPAASQFRLILVATGAAQASVVELSFMLVVAALAAAGAVWLAIWSLRKELGRK